MIAKNAIDKDDDLKVKSNESAMKNFVFKNEVIVHRKFDGNSPEIIAKKRGRPRKIL